MFVHQPLEKLIVLICAHLFFFIWVVAFDYLRFWLEIMSSDRVECHLCQLVKPFKEQEFSYKFKVIYFVPRSSNTNTVRIVLIQNSGLFD